MTGDVCNSTPQEENKSSSRSAVHASEPTKSMFQTILFPPGFEKLRAEHDDQPAHFIDLNLDQIIDAVVAKRNEAVLRTIFQTPYRNEEIVRYRQGVFADLERPEVFEIFPPFCETMRMVRANLDYTKEISYRCHKHMVFLRAVSLYCESISIFLYQLRSLALQSVGLNDLRAYITGYTESSAFQELAKDTVDIRGAHSKITYSMLFRSDKVTVRKYASEPDYTVTILDRFAKFRESNIKLPLSAMKPEDNFSLNHIEEGILEFVGRLFPEQYRRLEKYVDRYTDFIDDVVARFDREIGFFIAYLEFITPLKKAGLPFCHPDVSALSKDTEVTGSFDLALAAKLVAQKSTIVCSDFRLSTPERLIVVSGPNQGGKTTFARMFGQLHFLAGLGCPVPGRFARLFLPDNIFTHFEREEDITNLRGKLEDELVRLHQSCQAMTPNSVIVLNEIFNSTSHDDQVFLSINVLKQILAIDPIGVCVTFIDALSKLCEKTVSMVSTVDPEDPARRTFEIVRKPADGLAYALSLAQKHGVTYDQLRRRVHP